MKETTPKYIILNFLKLGIKKILKAGKEKNIICKEDDIIFLIRYNASVEERKINLEFYSQQIYLSKNNGEDNFRHNKSSKNLLPADSYYKKC